MSMCTWQMEFTMKTSHSFIHLIIFRFRHIPSRMLTCLILAKGECLEMPSSRLIRISRILKLLRSGSVSSENTYGSSVGRCGDDGDRSRGRENMDPPLATGCPPPASIPMLEVWRSGLMHPGLSRSECRRRLVMSILEFIFNFFRRQQNKLQHLFSTV